MDLQTWLSNHPNQAFLLAFGLVSLWCAGWISASIVYRKRQGKALFPKPPAGAKFVRTNVSGRSRRGFLTSLGGARNCLMVAVTDRGLTVTPVFPLNLMFLPEVWDLEHDIAFADIKSLSMRKGVGTEILDIHFRSSNGEARHFELRLPDASRLIAAVENR